MDAVLIQAVIAALNEIEVKGQNNLSRLLGCINTLNQLIEQHETGEEVTNG